MRLPKIGWVKFRDTRPIRGKVKNVTVARAANGWHISFACEIAHVAVPSSLPAVGIDRGVANALVLSTGEPPIQLPDSLVALDRHKRRAQRTASRRLRGSRRHAKAQRRVAALAARAARIRQDWRHKTTHALARRFGTVVLEDLNTRNMTRSAKGTIQEPGRHVRQKAGLNREILNQGWHAFAATLAYKLEERGGRLETVPPHYTSQTCSACGAVDKASRKSQAVFHCRTCGFRAHADHNAAINILRRNTASMLVEDRHQPSCEARTTSGSQAQEIPSLQAGEDVN